MTRMLSDHHSEIARHRSTIETIALGAALGIGLGLTMQSLVLALRLMDGVVINEGRLLAEFAGSISWSTLVCTGVAVAMTIGKARAAIAGVLGALFAPLALAGAKTAEKVMLAVLEATEKPALLPIETIGLARALEYGSLALMLTMLTERRAVRLSPYLVAGATVGLLFGGGVTSLQLLAAPQSLLGTLAVAAREIASPIGCALVIYVAQRVTRSYRKFTHSATRAGFIPARG